MKRNELLKNNHYENIKTTSLKSDFKFRVKKRSEGRNRRFGSSKDSNQIK
jgi:hypothetical protein